MATLHSQFLATVGIIAAAVAVFAPAPTASAAPDAAPSAPCYNGVFPLNPDIDNCALPKRPPRVLGSAPDQTAILACGDGPWRAQCLSLYVNGGYGLYPGAVLVPGYHP